MWGHAVPKAGYRQASLKVSHVNAVLWGCQSRELHCRVFTQHRSCCPSQPRPPLFPVAGASAEDGHRTSLVSTPRGLSNTQVKLVCRCWLSKELKCRSRCRAHPEPCTSSLWTQRGPVSAQSRQADPGALPQHGALPQLGLPHCHRSPGLLSPYSLHCPLTHSPVWVQALHEGAILQPVEQCQLWKFAPRLA